jgi:hypothetical protein
MRITRSLVAVVIAALAAPASGVTIDWVAVENPGNPADSGTCQVVNCGSVAYTYQISKYEVTNSQYTEFLNAVDPNGTNALGLYNPLMGTDTQVGGIRFIATRPVGSKYLVKTSGTGFANKPVTLVSFYDAARFANWLNNGQGSADTETGAYTLLGGTPLPSNGLTVTRNALATTFLPSHNEWYKAAFYSPSAGVYFDYPAGTDTQTVCSVATATPNRANCLGAAGPRTTDVGSYSGSPSPYGTFDQGGNVHEWNEHSSRGGHFGSLPSGLASSVLEAGTRTNEFVFLGFRVASLVESVPEPGAAWLVTASVVALTAVRRRR